MDDRFTTGRSVITRQLPPAADALQGARYVFSTTITPQQKEDKSWLSIPGMQRYMVVHLTYLALREATHFCQL
jgi:cell division inhibitor SulA